MKDVIFVLMLIGFFALFVALKNWCDKQIK